MEALSCVKAFVSATTQLKNNKTDDNVIYLQRQLDVCISITNKGCSLDFFNPKHLMPIECLKCLVDLISDPITRNIPTVTQKTLLLLRNLAMSTDVVHTLHVTFHLMSILANFLQSQSQDINICLCLKLMQKVSYGCEISCSESYIEDLVKFIIIQIENDETEKTLWCLGLLANLCRHNFTMQVYIKEQEQLKRFYKRLCSFLAHKNQKLVLFVLSIITNVCLNDDIGRRVMNAQNIHKTFQLLFNILVNCQSLTTRQYAVDLFTDLLQLAPHIQNSLLYYEHLDNCLLRILPVLSSNSLAIASQILELLNNFCCVSGLRSIVCRVIMASTSTTTNSVAILSDISRWALHSTTDSTMAVDLLRQIFEELLSGSDCGSREAVCWSDIVLPLATQSLTGSVPADHLQSKRLLVKRLKVLELLIYDSVKRDILSKLDLNCVCASVVENQLTSCTLKSALKLVPCLTADREDSSDVAIDIVLHALSLMFDIQTVSKVADRNVNSLLQDTRLIPLLVNCLQSVDVNQVRIVLRILVVAGQLNNFAHAQMCESLVTINSQKSHTATNNCRCHVTNSKSGSGTGNGTSSGTGNGTSACNSLDTPIQAIIDKMNNGFELRDARASEIIAIYEHRIHSIQVSENSLQDLLEAKTLTLTQTEKLLAQYRTQIAQYEAEANKLRFLLQDWEKSCEQYRERLNETLAERDRISSELDAALHENNRLCEIAESHKQLTELSTQQNLKLEAAQRSLAALRLENQSVVEMSEMLKRHHETLRQQHETVTKQVEELDTELKSINKQLKDKDVKLQELNRSLKLCNERCTKLTTDNSELESAVDRLRTELTKTEQSKKELQHEVTSLEVVCRQHESSLRQHENMLKDKELKINALQAEIDKHANIVAMIHNLSGGKLPAK